MQKKDVILTRVTHFPTEVGAMFNLSVGRPSNSPISLWVAIGVNTQEIIARGANKQEVMDLLKEHKYNITKVLNDWN